MIISCPFVSKFHGDRGAHQHAGRSRRDRRTRRRIPRCPTIGGNLEPRAIVGASARRCHVGEREIYTHRRRARIAQAHREDRVRIGPLRDRRTANAQSRRVIIGAARARAIVEDRRDARRVRDRRIGRTAQRHGEALALLEDRIVENRHRDRLTGHARAKCQDAAARHVVGSGERAAITGREVDRHGPSARRAQRHRKSRRSRRFVHAQIVDRQ